MTEPCTNSARATGVPDTREDPRPDQPCTLWGSECGHTCYLADGAWVHETTISMGGIDNDVQVYCQCEHHEGDEHQQPEPGLTALLDARRRQARR